ncbi:uncharacterized protein LOC118435618 [Folsomia candida]|uniref:Uncharacterized protein n=1 Tax=Folsomia candida TaxID=158441 RepID=A0A226E896_FOLCA|nr:uncharacterized protein LOC118435618 [Folsomia candida]OXA53520.1 hypothetical protein Fcan01_10544 [Folsomia candida]
MEQLLAEQEEERKRDDADAAVADGRKQRKKQFRWKLNHDLALVKAVLAHTPFSSVKPGDAWATIAGSINKLFELSLDKLAVHRRFDLVLEAHRKEETKNRYRSGIEEEVCEIVRLLNDLMSLIDDQKLLEKGYTQAKQKKLDDSKLKAEEIRVAACTTIKRSGSSPENPGPVPKKSPTDSTLIDLWKEKQESERQQEMKRLDVEQQRYDAERAEKVVDRDLEKKKLDLQQQQFELERDRFNHQRDKDKEEFKLREKELILREEERKSQMATQTALLQLLMKKCEI